MGDYERTVDELPSPQAKFASKPIISGKDGDRTLNLHQFARDGVTLVGRVQEVRDRTIFLAQDLKANLARADKFEANFVRKIDDFIAKNGVATPQEHFLCSRTDTKSPKCRSSISRRQTLLR